MVRIGWENVRGGYYIKKLLGESDKHTEQISKNTQDIAKNTEDIAKNTQDIHNLTPQGYGEIVEEVNQLKSDMLTKAEIDGSYEDMTVGNAEQLVSTVFVDDNEPYQFRTSGGSADIGDREHDEIVGGTVAWNQLLRNGDFSNDLTNWTKTGATATVTDGIVSIQRGSGNGGISQNIGFITGHKYLAISRLRGDETLIASIRTNNVDIPIPMVNGWQIVAGVISGDSTQSLQSVYFRIPSNSPSELVLYVDYVMLFDLTIMLGTTVADYIYSLEQATTGAGVAWFRKLFPNSFYEYNARELKSVDVSSHDMVGFNAYNTTTGTAKLVGGMQYQITGTYTSITFEDGTTITPDIDGYFTPEKTGAISVAGGNATDTCVHLVWDGERDGEYEPYVKYSYPLDADLELRGIPKLDANNKLYYDGDIYKSDGTVTRRFGIVDMGTLDWTRNEYEGLAGGGDYSAIIDGRRLGAIFGHMICSGYEISSVRGASNIPSGADKLIFTTGVATTRYIYVIDSSYASAEAFKTAMSGVYLVYELATPTTESADPYQNPQIVDDFGTEEYVTTSIVPVGHETKYANNLRAKLEMAPESPNGDGDYIVRQVNGQNTYVPLVIPNELPTAPTEDGTYVLKCTVSDGSVTYSWDVQS